jgi:hypothetical protein
MKRHCLLFADDNRLPPKTNHLRCHLDMKIKNDSFNGLTVQHWPANVHEQGCLFVDGFSAHIGPPGQTGPKIVYVFKLISKSTRTDRENSYQCNTALKLILKNQKY